MVKSQTSQSHLECDLDLRSYHSQILLVRRDAGCNFSSHLSSTIMTADLRPLNGESKPKAENEKSPEQHIEEDDEDHEEEDGEEEAAHENAGANGAWSVSTSLW